MKNKIYKYIAASLLVAGFSSCDESTWETPNQGGTGELALNSLLIDVNNAEKVISRASADVNDFIVKVVNTSTEATVGSFTYGEMPEIVTLPAGETYKIMVESHEITKAEWDKPYFKGASQPFKIEKAKITKVGEITAYFSSLKVTIKFADDLKQFLGDDAKVIVKGTNGAELVYTPKETRSGYFAIEGSTTFAAHFSGTVDGAFSTSETAFKDVAEGQHHILTFNLKGAPEIPEQSGQIGGGDVELDVNYEVSDVNFGAQVEEDLLDSSDRPGQEDPQQPEDPEDPGKDDPNTPDNPNDEYVVFSAKNSPNLHLDQVNIASADFGNAIVNIKVPLKIKDFQVDIDSTDENFLLAIDDFNLRSFNLINPSEEVASSLSNLQLPYGKDVEEKEEVDFDITAFIMFLQYPGEHTFKLTVTDSEGHVGVLPLRFTSQD